jgi:hypothetical protein
MTNGNRSRWFHRSLLGLGVLGLIVDLLLPHPRLGTISLLLLGIWCVRRILIRIEETAVQFERAFRLGQEVEQRRVALDRELAPVRELIRPTAEPPPVRADQVVELPARSAEEPATPQRTPAEPLAKAITLSAAPARERHRHRRRP